MSTSAVISHSVPVKIWGITPAERLRRALRKQGVTVVHDVEEVPADSSSVLLIRADQVYDDRLLEELLRRPGSGLRADAAPEASVVAAHLQREQAKDGLRNATGVPPDELVAELRLSLLKSQPPFVLPVTEATRRDIERKLYDASYKGITDLVTKWFWPTPARLVVRGCVRLGVQPNHVTIAGFGLMVAALLLFLRGAYGWGLAAAWVMTFFDTVDGKLARTTLTSSSFGHWLDKLTDIFHPPFWYLAWGIGLGAHGHQWAEAPVSQAALNWSIFAFYAGGRVAEGLAGGIIRGGIFVWRPLDSVFRLITARRNTCLLLLTGAALAGEPELGLYLVAVWTAATTLFLWLRLGLAWAAWRPDRQKLDSWMAQAPGRDSR